MKEADLTHYYDNAACADSNPDLFQVEEGQKPTDLRSRIAKRICRECPVIQECLQFGIETGDKYGIYGGLLPRERNKIYRLYT